jgi:aminomethyltransferase
MVPFAGWEMPVQYSSLMLEHHAVRQKVGLFDISHMGQFLVSGDGAEAFLNLCLTNDCSKLAPGQGQYSLLLNEQGGVIDDLITYRISEREFFLVVNAARITEDWQQLSALRSRLSDDERDFSTLQLSDISSQTAGFAVQGPGSPAVFHEVFGAAAPWPEKNTLLLSLSENGPLYLCGTGYTGELGFELFVPATSAVPWADSLLAAVEKQEGRPCGLGCRDTLRLEMAYPLNGNDLDPDHSPLEAGLRPFVKLEKERFIGHEILRQQAEQGLSRRLCAIRVAAPAPPPRHGYAVHAAAADGSSQPIATLTSGSLSPSLQQGIALAYLPIDFCAIGTALAIEVRSKLFPAEVVKKPFYHPPSAHSSNLI